MANARQIEANRANSLRSTGPRTGVGKAISRRNALQHGLTAQRILLDGEDPRLFEALRQDLIQELQPRAPSQQYFVDGIAMLFWRLHRVPAFEAAILEWTSFRQRHVPTEDHFALEEEIKPPSEEVIHQRYLGRALEEAMADTDLFSKLSRYESRLLRELERMFNLLRKAQASPVPTSSLSE